MEEVKAPGDPLYAIVGDYLDVLDAIEDAGGEITPEVEEWLTRATENFEEKVERCALAVRRRESEAAVLREEAKALSAKASARENAAKALRNYVLDQMRRADISSVKALRATVLVGSSEKVVLSVPPEKLPKEFRAQKVEALKSAIAKAMKAGRKVRGAAFETSHFLTIR